MSIELGRWPPSATLRSERTNSTIDPERIPLLHRPLALSTTANANPELLLPTHPSHTAPSSTSAKTRPRPYNHHLHRQPRGLHQNSLFIFWPAYNGHAIIATPPRSTPEQSSTCNSVTKPTNRLVLEHFHLRSPTISPPYLDRLSGPEILEVTIPRDRFRHRRRSIHYPSPSGGFSPPKEISALRSNPAAISVICA
ncbi:hypothetical protein HPP92_015628 [Vanilla planifolia]|uniref:Uncharacterized protein n=1 Tax=Vanilla planifolia TaxID=51239 RepID=A0A835QJB6_VANPL|nr:hypothetical protein HPP92_016443 [Vanilla planifolia]KAG0471082.1 hypothetical protein HPP92_015628 [Vanilla planifolia]